MDSDGARSAGPSKALSKAPIKALSNAVTGTVTETLPTLRQAQGRPERSRGASASRGGSGLVAEVAGVVAEQLPSNLYRVKLDGGGGMVIAHITDRIDRNFVRVLVGDRVHVELSRVDAGRGRIVRKIG